MKTTYVVQYKWPQSPNYTYSDYYGYSFGHLNAAQVALDCKREEQPFYDLRLIRRETSETVIETREATQ